MQRVPIENSPVGENGNGQKKEDREYAKNTGLWVSSHVCVASKMLLWIKHPPFFQKHRCIFIRKGFLSKVA